MKTIDAALLILAIIVVLEGLLIAGSMSGIINISGNGEGVPGISINLGGTALSVVDSEGNTVPQEPDDDVSSQMDLCKTFTHNYPTYFFVREINCENAGGDWACEQDRIGCYDITFWDHATMCGTPEVQTLKAGCSSLGGEWTCTAVEVSCET